MSRLTRLRREYGEQIGDVLDDLTVLTPLNDLQLREIYSDEELAALRKGLAAVRKATSENEKQAKMLEIAGLVSKAAGKIGFG